MPTSAPWSITTSEPMSFCAIALTASSTAASGVVVKSVLPLMRRISLTSMGTSSGRGVRVGRGIGPDSEVTPAASPRQTPRGAGLRPRMPYRYL